MRLLRCKDTIRITVDLLRHKELSKLKRKENEKFLKRLKKFKPQKLDSLIHPIHDEVFACTDCLQCANCCKTTGPKFIESDITRISKLFKMKTREFEDEYLRKDSEGEFVLKSVPCTFLGADNKCYIYDVRPKACREFPHTDRRKQTQILDHTLKNIEVCPAVYEIVEKLKKIPGVTAPSKSKGR